MNCQEVKRNQNGFLITVIDTVLFCRDIKNVKKYLQCSSYRCIMAVAVTLIAVKREVAAHRAGFPRSECQEDRPVKWSGL